MRILNPLHMNDWEIKKFLYVVLAIQIIIWAVLSLDAIDLQIPVIRQLIGVVYLSFIPGVIILRILRLHNLTSIETLLYSVGLSLATLMFTGALINAIYPLFGISEPLSIMSLTITLNVLVLVLCAISYVRDRYFSDTSYIDIKGILSPPVLFLLLIPLISILGTQLVNFYQSNILLMVLFAVIAFTVILIGFNKFIPRSLYPLAVFSIALSLLFYRTLFSQYISGYDIHEEYYVANLVITTGNWDSSAPIMINGMLSITMLSAVLSNVANMDLTWVFKVIYPLLFALVPFGLYQVFRKQSNERIAFLACFFFVAVYQFYIHLPHILRQQVGTMFFVLLLLQIVGRGAHTAKRTFLSIVFGASLIVSHYGLSYIYIGYMIFFWVASRLAGTSLIRKMWDWLHRKIGIGHDANTATEYSSSNTRGGTIRLGFFLLYVVMALTWYIFTSGSRVFTAIMTIGERVVINFSRDFLNPETSQGLSMLTQTPAPGFLHLINAAVLYLNQGLIIFGVIVLIWRFHKHKFQKEYVAFAALSLAILAIGVLLPSATYNIERLYHMMLVILAPAFVLGALTVMNLIGRFAGTVKAGWMKKWPVPVFAILSVYLAIFFLSQTGFIWQLTEGHSGSYILSQAWQEENADTEWKVGIRATYTPAQDALSAKWLSANGDATEKVYATYFSTQVHTLTSYGMYFDGMNPLSKVPPLTPQVDAIPEGAYVYLQYVNVVDGIGTTWDRPSRTLGTFNTTDLAPLLDGMNKIYTNGGSEIYK